MAGALEAKAGAADGLRELLLQHNSIGDRGGLGLALSRSLSLTRSLRLRLRLSLSLRR